MKTRPKKLIYQMLWKLETKVNLCSNMKCREEPKWNSWIKDVLFNLWVFITFWSTILNSWNCILLILRILRFVSAWLSKILGWWAWAMTELLTSQENRQHKVNLKNLKYKFLDSIKMKIKIWMFFMKCQMMFKFLKS